MVAAHVVWHGSEKESYDLTTAIARYCTCVFSDAGARISTCAAHEMLLGSQRALDGLLFERRWWATHEPGASKRVIKGAP